MQLRKTKKYMAANNGKLYSCEKLEVIQLLQMEKFIATRNRELYGYEKRNQFIATKTEQQLATKSGKQNGYEQLTIIQLRITGTYIATKTLKTIQLQTRKIYSYEKHYSGNNFAAKMHIRINAVVWCDRFTITNNFTHVPGNHAHFENTE